MELTNALNASLATGFIDGNLPSTLAYQPEILTNDKVRQKKVLTSLLRALDQCDEFWFCIAFVTTSGVATLMNTLLELERRGVPGKIIASTYLEFTDPIAIRRLQRFSNIEIRFSTATNLHTKGYLFSRKGKQIYDIIIGSSNLTQSALSVNSEWNLKISSAKSGALAISVFKEFEQLYETALVPTEEMLIRYEENYRYFRQKSKVQWKQRTRPTAIPTPNKMQREALANIQALRDQGKNKALLISATGTGKTYLAAFDVARLRPKRFLFIVHRRTIAEKAKDTFQTLIGGKHSMSLYSGDSKNVNADYLFCTIQTISRDANLRQFAEDHFDYIVIDETHRAGAGTYRKVLDHFKPQFILGMTATPERSDDFDIFKLFNHNIAFEFRLHQAMEENMVSPFHYYGVTDLIINGVEINEKTAFKHLVSEERTERILATANLYGVDDGETRGLVFCSRKEECYVLAEQFRQRGVKALALTGDSSPIERQRAIEALESKDEALRCEYILTVDIFNEGVDIPRVNQIIMLRPTQSAIVFVQQLGRGLRKLEGKEYLTVIDFIGNYANNFLVPIALYGDTSYNKDNLRKAIASGSRTIPGASTINFDRISKERILQSIDASKIQTKKALRKEYDQLKSKLGRIPMMIDFHPHGARDAFHYVNYSKSYYNFVAGEERFPSLLSKDKRKLLEAFSKEINNGIRVADSLALRLLLDRAIVSAKRLREAYRDAFSLELTDSLLLSVINNLNLQFATETVNRKRQAIGSIYNFEAVQLREGLLQLTDGFSEFLRDETFYKFLYDGTTYSINSYQRKFKPSHFRGGFMLYEKYTRKDVFRILNWSQNPLAQNVGGYMHGKSTNDFAIFVNYHKAEDISASTKYEDEFVSPDEFKWMSKSKRKLSSPDITALRELNVRVPLFVKKSNDEGADFYYMGDMKPISESFKEDKISTDQDNSVSVVRVCFKMIDRVNLEIYEYLKKD